MPSPAIAETPTPTTFYYEVTLDRRDKGHPQYYKNPPLWKSEFLAIQVNKYGKIREVGHRLRTSTVNKIKFSKDQEYAYFLTCLPESLSSDGNVEGDYVVASCKIGEDGGLSFPRNIVHTLSGSAGLSNLDFVLDDTDERLIVYGSRNDPHKISQTIFVVDLTSTQSTETTGTTFENTPAHPHLRSWHFARVSDEYFEESNIFIGGRGIIWNEGEWVSQIFIAHISDEGEVKVLFNGDVSTDDLVFVKHFQEIVHSISLQENSLAILFGRPTEVIKPWKAITLKGIRDSNGQVTKMNAKLVEGEDGLNEARQIVASGETSYKIEKNKVLVPTKSPLGDDWSLSKLSVSRDTEEGFVYRIRLMNRHEKLGWHEYSAITLSTSGELAIALTADVLTAGRNTE